MNQQLSAVERTLVRLVEKVERANGLQHSGTPIEPEDWAELHQLTNEARGMLDNSASANQQATPAQMLLALKEAGLTFGECVNIFGVSSDTDPYAKAAQGMAREGEIEVDDTTVLSGSGDGGDYVLAWMWVSDQDAGIVSSATLSLEALQGLGYEISLDPDQAGKFYWRKDDDGSEISFDSQELAIAAASENALEIYTLSRCADCGKAHTDQTMVAIEKYSSPVTPGGKVPSGRCPDCGSLCFPIDGE